MKYCLYILILLTGIVTLAEAQDSGRRPGQSGFSLSNLTRAQQEIPDSLLVSDSLSLDGKRILGYKITPLLGEPYIAPLDTNQLNFANSTLTEGKSIGIGYLANLGSAAQTRIFTERKEARDFIFADAFDYWITTPENAYFYNTKVPYTHIMYNTDFASDNKTDQLKGVLTLNFGKHINIGGEADYIYARGFYNSNGNKLLNYRFFGNYITDRYEMRAHVSNFNFVYHENGGITDDRYITHPDDPEFSSGRQPTDSKGIPVRYSNFFNRVRGKNFFLTHRYNLGFDRTLEETDDEGNEITVFVPVSSIIHTISYEDNRRHAYASDENTTVIDSLGYDFRYRPDTIPLEDRASTWRLTNTIGLSLREGFQDWAKFGITAFASFEKRQFKLPYFFEERPANEKIPKPKPEDKRVEQPDYLAMQKYDEFSTYLGAEISKRQGSLLTYNARGELCIVGDDVGEFRLTGNLQTRFPLFKRDAIIKAEGSLKNVTPAFFMRHNSSRYFQWDNSQFSNEREVYVGGVVDLESTRTRLSFGVNNTKNYVFFNSSGLPEQYKNSIQVVTARFKQDFRYRALGWENEVVYQLSGKKEILPLPEITAYSNLYFTFKLAKVLSVQIGADVHYHTEYYAPYYEPGTLQFQLQNKENRVKVGNYPLINAYANFHLKQARFFISAYNLGSKFVDPNYFSLPHYPLNPMVIKAGIAVTFNN